MTLNFRKFYREDRIINTRISQKFPTTAVTAVTHSPHRLETKGLTPCDTEKITVTREKCRHTIDIRHHRVYSVFNLQRVDYHIVHLLPGRG